MQPDQPPLKKIPGAHLTPAVVIRIADHETGQQKKEVYRQIPVIDDLRERIRGVCLQQMEPQHNDGRHAAQPVQDFEVRFGF